MNFKMRFKLGEDFRTWDFKRNLRDLAYEIESAGEETISIKKNGFVSCLENGSSSFLIKRILVKEGSSEVIVNCEVDNALFFVVILTAIIAFFIQISRFEMSRNVIVLSRAFPIVVLAAMSINLLLILSTLRRDIKKALKVKARD